MKILLAILTILILSGSILSGQTSFISGGPELAYWEIGDKKHTVIVLHGGPCVAHQYLRPEFDLLQKHCRVIYYDQRGCGRSAGADTYLWSDHVEDLNRLIDSLVPDGQVFLAGSSWGSLLILSYAYYYPWKLKGLILSGLVKWKGEGLDYQTYQKGGYRSDDVDTLYLKPIKKTEEVARRAVWYTGRRSDEPLQSLKTAPILDSLKFIDVPVLVFTEDSTCFHSRAIEQYVKVLPNLTTYRISGGCHDTWLSNPELFFKISNKFIRRLRKRKRIKKN